jgi:hypothetical protein
LGRRSHRPPPGRRAAIAPAEIAAYRAEQAALLAPIVRASGARVE